MKIKTRPRKVSNKHYTFHFRLKMSFSVCFGRASSVCKLNHINYISSPRRRCCFFLLFFSFVSRWRASILERGLLRFIIIIFIYWINSYNVWPNVQRTLYINYNSRARYTSIIWSCFYKITLSRWCAVVTREL